MKTIRVALFCALASSAVAQIGNYLGPGILSQSAAGIGQASGQQVDLRFWVDISGVYDTSIQPYAVNAQGGLVKVGALYGESVDLGAYGSHQWKQAKLGLNYSGDFYHYQNNSAYDGSSHNLSLGFSYQQSRRLTYNLTAVAGTTSIGYGVPGFYGSSNSEGSTSIVNQPTALLFDNRLYYGNVTAGVSFVLSPRVTISANGSGFLDRRGAAGLGGLADTNGWSAGATVAYKMSRTKSIGITYEHLHFEFPPAFGYSDSDLAEASFSAVLSPRWSFNIGGGAFESRVQGVQEVQLSPVIAALLGESAGAQIFTARNILPSGSAGITGKFRTSVIGVNVGQTVVPGNGLYLTSRQESAMASYSYTGARKWNFGANGGYNKLQSIGQGLQPYSGITGGAGFSYTLSHAIHITGRYDYRHQQIAAGTTGVGYNLGGSRVTLGLAFSPGDIPLSLW